MNILGLAQSHSSSACLMIDGEIVGMIQEERLTKRKNQVAFPKRAIQDLLDTHLGGDASKVDRVAFAENWVDPYTIALDRFSKFSVHDHIQENYRLWRPHFYGGKIDIGAYWREEYHSGRFRNQDHNHDLGFFDEMDWEVAARHFSDVERPAAMRRHFGWDGEVLTQDHHTCHAYYAAYGQALSEEERKNALVLTADAWGEGRNWSAWTFADDGSLVEISSGDEHAVARLYKFVTLILGMKPNEHEYKVMGLAPYSKSLRHIEETEKVFLEALDFRDGNFVSNRPLTDSYFDLRDRLEGHRFDNIAAALQGWASRVTCAWASHWLRATNKHVLCFSGGLSMNIRLNGDLVRLPEVDRLYVPASGGDESLCAGACFGTSLKRGEKAKPMRHAYLGSVAKSDEWSTRLADTGMDARDFDILTGTGPKALAKLLAADCIIARCTGPSEFGARALGNRSVLANPSNSNNVKIINEAIKNRDFWMPFTPSILREYADQLLQNPKGLDSPYMTIGFDSTETARHQIPAGLHFSDFSARPQLVDRQSNPEFWALIDAFRELTGVPALLNTSLNLHGEPMNYSVADAVRTMALSDLDFLEMPGNALLYKKRAAAGLKKVLGKMGKAA